jgi:hypothetical protein
MIAGLATGFPKVLLENRLGEKKTFGRKFGNSNLVGNFRSSYLNCVHASHFLRSVSKQKRT